MPMFSIRIGSLLRLRGPVTVHLSESTMGWIIDKGSALVHGVGGQISAGWHGLGCQHARVCGRGFW
jgi:hypothetical protein